MRKPQAGRCYWLEYVLQSPGAKLTLAGNSPRGVRCGRAERERQRGALPEAPAPADAEVAAVEVGDGGEESRVREGREAGDEGFPHARWGG
jgi:hypothetical protein